MSLAVPGAWSSSPARSPAKAVSLLCEEDEVLGTLGQCNLPSTYPKEAVVGGFSSSCLLRETGYFAGF